MELRFTVWCIYSKHWKCAFNQAHLLVLREGQPRREAGAQNLGASYVWEVAGLPNSSGGATKFRLYPYNEEWERMRTGTCNLFHVRLALHPASLLYGKA